MDFLRALHMCSEITCKFSSINLAGFKTLIKVIEFDKRQNYFGEFHSSWDTKVSEWDHNGHSSNKIGLETKPEVLQT